MQPKGDLKGGGCVWFLIGLKRHATLKDTCVNMNIYLFHFLFLSSNALLLQMLVKLKATEKSPHFFIMLFFWAAEVRLQGGLFFGITWGLLGGREFYIWGAVCHEID